MNEKFKIRGIGLDTSSLYYPLIPEDHYDYILIDLVKNNDFYLKEYFKTNYSALIVKTPYLDSVELVLRDILIEINKANIDLLFVESGADLSKARKLSIVSEWGISHPATSEEIFVVDSALKEKGIKLGYVLLSACPLDYNKELFEAAESLGLTVMIDNPMGGYLSAPRNIEAFSVPYLLCFAANQGEVVFLSSRDLVKAGEGKEYLTALIGKKSSQMFELKKTIQKPVKPLKKIIYTSTKIGKEIMVPYNSPELITTTEDTVFNLGKWIEQLPTVEESEPDSIEGKVREFLKITHVPEDGGREAKFTHFRYVIGGYMTSLLPEWDLEYSYTDSIMLITATLPASESGWLWWYKYKPEEKRYFCLLMGKENSPIFYEVDPKITPLEA